MKIDLLTWIVVFLSVVTFLSSIDVICAIVQIFRLIYMIPDPSLVVKWALSLIEVETTLKWGCMFSLVATTIYFA